MPIKSRKQSDQSRSPYLLCASPEGSPQQAHAVRLVIEKLEKQMGGHREIMGRVSRLGPVVIEDVRHRIERFRHCRSQARQGSSGLQFSLTGQPFNSPLTKSVWLDSVAV
jgi:hypothetical protein